MCIAPWGPEMEDTAAFQVLVWFLYSVLGVSTH